jgi:hypothetical protein
VTGEISVRGFARHFLVPKMLRLFSYGSGLGVTRHTGGQEGLDEGIFAWTGNSWASKYAQGNGHDGYQNPLGHV